MKSVLLLVALTFGVAKANVVVAPASGKVILEAPQCEQIENLMPKNWVTSCAKKVSGGWFSSGPCQFDVSACVPKVVSELHAVKAQVNGLTGWNLALFMAGVHPVLRLAPAEEFHFFMNSPLCQHKKTEPSLGDILATRDGDGDELGASIYLSENLVFTKLGPQTHEAYLVKIQDSSKHEGHQLDTYQCDSFESYLAKVDASLVKLKNAHLQLSSIEHKLAHVLPVKVSITEAEELEIKTKIQELIEAYRAPDPHPVQKSATKAKGRKAKIKLELPVKITPEILQGQFLRDALRVRLMGLSEHLKANAKSVLSSELEVKKPLIEQIDGAFLPTPVPSAQPE